jgi:hypothetical protein
MQQQFWVPDVRGTIPQEPLPDRSPASARTCQKPLYWFPIPGMDNALGQAYDLPTSSSPPMASHPTFDTTSTISSSPIKTSHRTRAGRGRGALLMTSLIQYPRALQYTAGRMRLTILSSSYHTTFILTKPPQTGPSRPQPRTAKQYITHPPRQIA